MTYSAPSSITPGSNPAAREFTEKWLQALSLSASHSAAKRIKPLLNDVDSLCMQRSEQEHFEAATRLWEYASEAGLVPLLESLPSRRGAWRFDGEEAFSFEQSASETTSAFDHWVQGLGLTNQRVPMMAIINQEDWSAILRKEAIRQGKSLSVIGAPPAKESLLWLNCEAEWDRSRWTIRFETPNWITQTYDGGMEVPRPEMRELDKAISTSIDFALEHFAKAAATAPHAKLHEQPWMQSIPRLLPLHQQIVQLQTERPSPWFCRTWSCVWPVIYREQNRLRGACDIDIVRRELELSFRNVPQLTIWMFVFAKLICVHQVGRGLGICGEFK